MVSNLSEIGRTGLQAANGVVTEDILSNLRGPQGRRIFAEMAENDPIIGGILLAWEKIIHRLDWHIEVGEDATPDDKAASDFVQECLDDMSESWQSTLSSIMTMTTYGWSFHEVVYKHRQGQSDDPTRKSKFDDGRIGWRKWAIRGQNSLLNWRMDDNDGLQGMIQMTGFGVQQVIPIEKALLFRTSSLKGNPEGRPLIRSAYRPWFYKKRIEELEAIGIERDLAGLPVAFADPQYFMPNASEGDKALMAELTRMVSTVKRNQAEGLVFPVAYDDRGNKTIDFQLLSSGGSRQFDMDATIARYNQQIAMSMLADFIMLGHENVGSQSLGVSKMDLWMMAVEAVAESIAEVVNSHAIPRLLALNGMSTENTPELVFGAVDNVNLAELATFIKAMSDAGAITMDAPLEDYLRDVADLPPVDEEAREQENMFAAPDPSPAAPAQVNPLPDDQIAVPNVGTV